jgi:hypothetical protein
VPSGSQPERRLVSAAAVSDSLGVSEAVASVLLDVLDAVSPEPGCAAASAGAAGATEGDMHQLLLLLFVNMYSRPHVQSSLRAAGDAWPAGAGERAAAGAAAEAPAPPSPSLGKASSPASPTKPRRAHAPGGDDEALQVAFVLRHLATLLPLLRSTPAAGSAGCAARP